MSYFIAIDLGTTGCRSMVFDENLCLLGAEYREYGLIISRPDWYEQDATLWWDLSILTMRTAIANAGIDGANVRAIAVSSQGISIVPVDRNFLPLRTALSWMDVRAVAEERQLIRELGIRETFTRTGKRIAATYSLPKILWIQNNQPEIWAQTYKLLMPLDFLTAKLTGRAVTDPSMASGTLLYDIQNMRWDVDTLRRYHIPQTMLPDLQTCGTIAGKVLPDVAAAIGLSPDCIVSVGAQDQRCAALGAGLSRDSVVVSLGTAAAICKLWDRCRTAGNMSAGWSPYIFQNSWVTEGVVGSAGASLRWIRDIMFPGESYDIIDAEAIMAQTRGNNLLCLPYLNGPGFPRFDPESTGCFHGVSLATVRGDFALSVMEGVAFQIREILETMDQDSQTSQLILFGGGAKSSLWRQIFADVTGLCVAVPENEEAAGVGAALLAGMSVGAFDRENPPHMTVKNLCVPSNMSAILQAKYVRFRNLEQKLESTAGGAI